MPSNKSARQELEMLYGKGCMFFRANIPERLKQAGIQIKGYKVFVGEKRYKARKIKRLEGTLTYHHLEHKADGGSTSVENGALVNELAHRYLHSLPRQQEEIVNEMLREYKEEFELKGGIITPTEHGIKVIQPITVSFGGINEQDCITLPVFDGGKDDYERKFNRAKVKRETQDMINEELYSYYNDDIDDELER